MSTKTSTAEVPTDKRPTEKTSDNIEGEEEHTDVEEERQGDTTSGDVVLGAVV